MNPKRLFEQVPRMSPPSGSEGNKSQERCDVLIITAADGEGEAVRAVTDGIVGGWTEEVPPDHPFPIWWCSYKAADGRHLRVAQSRTGQMGGDATAYSASALVTRLKPQCLAMSGVCAGCPGWAHLGDVLIANQLYRYDAGERVVENGVEVYKHEITTYQLPPEWIDPARNYSAARHAAVLAARPKLLEDQELWLLGELFDGRDPLQSPLRSVECPDWSNTIGELWRRGDLVEGELQLTTQGHSRIRAWRLQHPDGPSRAALPKVCSFPLGTGNNLQRDPQIFQRLSTNQRLIFGLDMEGSAIGLVGYYESRKTIVVKGVMDFAEPGRTYQYRSYAARAAAEVLLGFLRDNLVPRGRTAADVLRTGIETL